jgi:hypothetical protein
MDPHAILDLNVVLDNRMSSDAYVMPNFVLFTDHDTMAGLKVIADDVSRVDHAMRTDHGPFPDVRWQFPRPTPLRRHTQDHVFADLTIGAKNDIRIEVK